MRGTKHHREIFPNTLQRIQKPVPPLLIEANRLFSDGYYDQAGSIYERLASNSLDRQDSRSAFLFLQAGRAFYMARENAAGTALIHQGLSLLAEQKRWLELTRFGWRVMNGLNRLGLREEADEVKNWMEISFPEYTTDSIELTSLGEIHSEIPLPKKCPLCGALVNPADLEWVTDSTAECLYCGSVVRADIV